MKKFILGIFVSLFCLTISAVATPGETKLQWLGHAAFKITTPKGQVLLIDPWVVNPQNPDKDPIKSLGKVDYILITHGHFDHLGQAVEIAKKTGARLITNFELGTNLVKALGFPKDQAGFDTLMNMGGEITVANGEVIVAMVPAVHSSSLEVPQKNHELIYAGNAAGFVIKITDGPTIYDTGDTAYFSDMKLIGETFRPDVALINAGGHFGMEQKMAARTALDVQAKLVIPQHYASFPILSPDVKVLFAELDEEDIPYYEMKPGETVAFLGSKLVRP